MSTWEYSSDCGAIRLFALWLLVDRSEQAIFKGSRPGEDCVQAERGRPSGRPPAPRSHPQNPDVREFHADAHRELAYLLRRECSLSLTAQETRRVAELLEFLNRDDEARLWWGKAAVRGDADARDYIEILNAETSEEGELSCPDRRDSGFWQRDRFASFVSELASHSPGFAVSADSVQSVLQKADVQLREGVQNLVREVEQFLAHPDRMTDGRRC